MSATPTATTSALAASRGARSPARRRPPTSPRRAAAGLAGWALVLAGPAEAEDAAPLQIGTAAEAAAAIAGVPAPQEASLTTATVATRPAPKGFLFSVVRDVLVDEVQGTWLYVKIDKRATTTRAIPIPLDRAILAECIAGGGVDDLVKGATITARFDPKGEVRPQIVLQAKVAIEVLENATVIDRGGNKLYVSTADGKARGFAIEGDASAWAEAVEGGDASALLTGAKVTIRFDPSGREPLRVKILQPSSKAAGRSGGGCGCDSRGALPPSSGAIGLVAALAALWLRQRWRPRRAR